MRFIHDPVNHAYIHNEEPVWQEDPLVELETRILALHDPSNVAAIIVEPVAGSAGWYLPPKGYLKRLREICTKHGILLIFDEVITGFGRMGTNFGADYYGVVPDMLNFAKCVTNGVIPLGGVVCRDFIYDAMMNSGAPDYAIEFFHGYTYSGHPVSCAAAIATLKLLKEENLFARAGQMGPVLGDAMHSAFKGLPNVIGIRSLGLAGAVELSSIAGAPGKRAYDIFLDCYNKGVLVQSGRRKLGPLPTLHCGKRAHRQNGQCVGRQHSKTCLMPSQGLAHCDFSKADCASFSRKTSEPQRAAVPGRCNALKCLPLLLV
jgi:beta-alanine--pyruvate transaminase